MQLARFAGKWQDRRWAAEGSRGAGRSLAQRLIAGGGAVLDVPAKLAARVRVCSQGHGRKTGKDDAVSIGLAVRDGSGVARVAPMTCWIRLQLARDHLAGIGALDARLKAAAAQISDLVTATGTTLASLFGVGPVIAARLLAETGDVSRFACLTGKRLSRGRTSIPATPPEGVRAFVVLDWKDDRLVGIEILDASHRLHPTSPKKRKSSADTGTS